MTVSTNLINFSFIFPPSPSFCPLMPSSFFLARLPIFRVKPCSQRMTNFESGFLFKTRSGWLGHYPGKFLISPRMEIRSLWAVVPVFDHTHILLMLLGLAPESCVRAVIWHVWKQWLGQCDMANNKSFFNKYSRVLQATQLSATFWPGHHDWLDRDGFSWYDV